MNLLVAISLLANPQSLHVVNGTAQTARHDGVQAVRLDVPAGHEHTDETALAIVPGTDFENGTIEVDVSGAPREGAGPVAKGFVGVAFRVQPGADAFELFYIRPVNGRIDDQAMRNHATQYVSAPDFGWKRLRAESPGAYESYADLEPGKWTHLKLVVEGESAKLYVNRLPQPALVVRDLKHGKSRGAIALWTHASTEAYFANLKVL